MSTHYSLHGRTITSLEVWLFCYIKEMDIQKSKQIFSTRFSSGLGGSRYVGGGGDDYKISYHEEVVDEYDKKAHRLRLFGSRPNKCLKSAPTPP